MQVKKQQLELDMEQWTGSKLGKEYVKAVYCHPAYLTHGHGYEFEQAPGDGEGQGSLECCSPWGHKESDTTERLHSLTHTVKGFGVVNKAEVDVFLELSCFFDDPLLWIV